MSKKYRVTYNAPVILGFAGISLLATCLNYLTGGFSQKLLFMTYHSSLINPLTWVRAFTHVFGHANWTHLVGNMSYILLLGPMLEEKYSSDKLIEIIGVTALVTSVFNYIVFSNVALSGASGVVFAFILLSSFTSFKEGEIPITFILVAVLFLGQQVYEGMFLNDNISNSAHIIGGIIGSVMGYNLNKKLR